MGKLEDKCWIKKKGMKGMDETGQGSDEKGQRKPEAIFNQV
jgi:hypothetical protein